MPVPYRVNSGDYSVAKQNGAPVIRIPFKDHNDTQSWEVDVTYVQDQSSFVPWKNQRDLVTGLETLTAFMTSLGRGYLVLESDTRAIGSGLVEFTRTFASLPVTRYEYGSLTYSFKITWGGTGAPRGLGELPYPIPTEIKYEYFLTKPIPEVAPNIYLVNNAYWEVGTAQSWSAFSAGQKFLAEDSVVRLYKTGMYERRGIWISMPNFYNP